MTYAAFIENEKFFKKPRELVHFEKNHRCYNYPMGSTRSKLKSTAVGLRKRGFSLKKIESEIGIRRSTLSGWLKNVQLTDSQREKLHNNWKEGLIKAREKAAAWHNAQKEVRLLEAEQAALEVLERLPNDKYVLDLALALLYLGEGSKKNNETSLGSSDALILRFFIEALRKNYKVPSVKFICYLYIRADQDPNQVKNHWSQKLGLPLENFRNVQIDKRTIGSRTYADYWGVCVVRCGNVAIQRKLLNISKRFCEMVVQEGG